MQETPQLSLEQCLHQARNIAETLPDTVQQLIWELDSFDSARFFETLKETEFYKVMVENPIFRPISWDFIEAVETNNISKLYLHLTFLVSWGNDHKSELSKSEPVNSDFELNGRSYEFFFAQMMPSLDSFRAKLYVFIKNTVIVECKKITDLPKVNMIYASTVFDALKWTMLKQYAAENMLGDYDKELLNTIFDTADMNAKLWIIRTMLKRLIESQYSGFDPIIDKILETFFAINNFSWWDGGLWILDSEEIESYERDLD